MSEVPPDLYPNILSRVFAESLLRFRCVCKAWRRIIDDPAFIKLHLHRQSDRGQLIFCNDAGTKHYTLSLDSINHYSSKIPTGKVVVASPLKPWIRHIPYLPVASCNGLILFSNRIGSVWALWNPFTREVHELPSHSTVLMSNKLECSSRIALGYDSATDDYKVVKIVECGYRFLTLVYRLKSNSWRRVKDCPSFPMLEVRGVFVNGGLHWSIYPTLRVMDGSILVFDLVTEDYYKIPLPCGHFNIPILDALDECLLVTWHGSVYRLDNYGGGGGGGGGNPWTELFSFSNMGFRGVRPIAYLKTKGKVLLKGDNDEYFWVNIKKKSAKKVTINGVQDCRYSQICLASLVRLN